MKDKYDIVYSLHNKKSRNACLNYIAFLFYSGDSLRIPWGFPVTINRISRDIPVWAGYRAVAVNWLKVGTPTSVLTAVETFQCATTHHIIDVNS